MTREERPHHREAAVPSDLNESREAGQFSRCKFQLSTVNSPHAII
jgi:hypothetical protein